MAKKRPSPARGAICDDFVDLIDPPFSGELRVWDADLIGFCVRVHASGRKTYCLKYKADGRARWHTIGPHRSPWSAAEAREAALQLLKATVGRGSAAAHRHAAGTLTIGELIDVYLEKGPATKLDKRASTWKTDASNLNRHVRPLLGDRLAGELRRLDVAQMAKGICDGETAGDVRVGKQALARVRGGVGTARRTLQVFAAMFAWAIHHELLTHHPAKAVRLPRAAVKERFLTRAEAERLFDTLEALERDRRLSCDHGAVLRLLLLTGARKSEIQQLRWSEVDVLRSRLVLPPERSKTGHSSGVRRIPLSTPALEILAARPRASSFVFPAKRGRSGHMTGLQKSWVLVRAEAGLGPMRIHDLRHSFASFAISNGESLVVISKALGHTTTRMTERYVHLAEDAVTDLADRTAGVILRTSTGLPRSSRYISRRSGALVG
jgi:integrase